MGEKEQIKEGNSQTDFKCRFGRYGNDFFVLVTDKQKVPIQERAGSYTEKTCSLELRRENLARLLNSTSTALSTRV